MEGESFEQSLQSRSDSSNGMDEAVCLQERDDGNVNDRALGVWTMQQNPSSGPEILGEGSSRGKDDLEAEAESPLHESSHIGTVESDPTVSCNISLEEIVVLNPSPEVLSVAKGVRPTAWHQSLYEVGPKFLLYYFSSELIPSWYPKVSRKS